MFGHQNDQHTQQDNNQPIDQSVNTLVSNDIVPVPPQNSSFTPPPLPTNDDSNYVNVTPSGSLDDNSSSSVTGESVNSDSSMPVSPAPDTNTLLDIKQQALSQLSPLVGHLEQTAEEKFRTTMMMIQASDNQALIKDAYESAQQISDEKSRAQALLDVINEINYFTQHDK